MLSSTYWLSPTGQFTGCFMTCFNITQQQTGSYVVQNSLSTLTLHVFFIQYPKTSTGTKPITNKRHPYFRSAICANSLAQPWVPIWLQAGNCQCFHILFTPRERRLWVVSMSEFQCQLGVGWGRHSLSEKGVFSNGLGRGGGNQLLMRNEQFHEKYV